MIKNGRISSLKKGRIATFKHVYEWDRKINVILFSFFVYVLLFFSFSKEPHCLLETLSASRQWHTIQKRMICLFKENNYFLQFHPFSWTSVKICSFPIVHSRRCWQRLENLITSQNLILQHFPSPLKKVASACSRVPKWNDAVDMTS